MCELLLPFVYGGKPWNIQRRGRDIRNRGGEKNGNVKEFSRQKKNRNHRRHLADERHSRLFRYFFFLCVYE